MQPRSQNQGCHPEGFRRIAGCGRRPFGRRRPRRGGGQLHACGHGCASAEAGLASGVLKTNRQLGGAPRSGPTGNGHHGGNTSSTRTRRRAPASADIRLHASLRGHRSRLRHQRSERLPSSARPLGSRKDLPRASDTPDFSRIASGPGVHTCGDEDGEVGTIRDAAPAPVGNRNEESRAETRRKARQAGRRTSSVPVFHSNPIGEVRVAGSKSCAGNGGEAQECIQAAEQDCDHVASRNLPLRDACRVEVSTIRRSAQSAFS